MENNKDWTKIDPWFAKQGFLSNKTNKQKWEEAGLTYQDAQESVSSGWELDDYEKIKAWKDHGFTVIEAQTWIAVGLANYEAKLATFLKQEGYQPKQIKNNLDHFWLLRWQKEVHLDFTEKLKNEWMKVFEEKGSWKDSQWVENEIYQTAQKWILAGLEPQEANFARWLENKDYLPKESERDSKKQKIFQLSAKGTLKQEYLSDSWALIYPDFAKINYSDQTYQQEWEKKGLTYQEAKDWIVIEFKPYQYDEVKRWIKFGFTAQQAEKWLVAGLDNKKDTHLVAYARGKGYQPNNINEEALRKEYENWKVQAKTAQEYSDIIYPKNIKELDIKSKNLTSSLIIDGFEWPQLEKIEGWDNRLTSLQITNCSSLTKLNFEHNQLTNLTITNCPNLTELNCWGNQLTTTDFLVTDKEKLTNLNIGGNKFTSDLTFLSQFINLKELNLSRNKFTGSLKPLKNYSELKKLNLESTKFTSGLEYLPVSLEEFYCSGTKLEAELKPYSGNWKKWKEMREKDQQLSHPSKRGWKTNLEGIDIAPFIPDKKEIKISDENYCLKQPINYQKIKGSEGKVNHWTTPDSKLFPIKLYHIKDNTVIWTRNTPNIKSYAIMSYVWGDLNDKSLLTTWDYTYQNEQGEIIAKQMGVSPEHNATGTTKWSIKALTKAIVACKLLGIDYLWMDQICIDQFNNEEFNQEVPKMRQYYGNAAVTLIPIQCKLRKEDAVDIIVKSEWFTRSWTFQEGWLSKHTLFMFDDQLVDGRDLAVDWVWKQPSYSEYATINPSEKEQASVKVATPIGWVYFKDGYKTEDRISLTLSQVLRGVRERQRYLSIDGIYSVLGLLPYGEKVKPKYKERGYQYNHSDLLEALYDVIKVAWENGYGEALGWHGIGHGLVPQIRDVSEGSTKIFGGIFVKFKDKLKSPLSLTEEGLKLKAYKYHIENVVSEIILIEKENEGFLIDGGLCTRSVQVKVNDNLEEIKLWGTKETLKEVQKEVQIDYNLLIPDSNEWESNIPFAILAKKQDNNHQRIGLVEIRNDIEKLLDSKVKEITISIYWKKNVLKKFSNEIMMRLIKKHKLF